MADRVILGIGGFASSGKDTLADLLVENFGFTKMSLADPIRALAEATNPIVATTGAEPLRYLDVLEAYGYQEAKEAFPEVRQFLQRLGSEAGRSVLGENVWVETLLKRMEGVPRVVVPDLRYRNEAAILKSNGAKTIRISRPGVVAPNNHPSEHDLADWPFDLFITNDRHPEQMLGKLEVFFSRTFPNVMRTR